MSVEAVADGLYAVRLPMPGRLNAVNAYVGTDADGSTIIDCGIAVAATECWAHALDTIGVSPGDMARIVVTHIHPDHIGGSRAVAELTGAPVYASATTVRDLPNTWGPGMGNMFASIGQHLREHGMPAERLTHLEHEPGLAAIGVQPATHVEDVDDIAPLRFAGSDWSVFETPGHADGHICLYDVAGRRLISGDHLLERISPAVGIYPGYSGDPLHKYIDSLRRTAELDVDVVFPGHGKPFHHARQRCAELIAHHAARVADCLVALDDGPATAYEVALRVFGDQHDPANERFSVTESLAHLEYARVEGQADRERHELVDASGAGLSVWKYTRTG